MPLDRATAKARLRKLLDDLATREKASPKDREDYVEELVELMADMMTTATVTGTVTTAGSATAQQGTITTSKLT
jgi:hypothetical protein